LKSAPGKQPEKRFRMKKIIIMTMLAGIMLVSAGISFAQEEDFENDNLPGIESELPDPNTGKIDLIDSEGIVIEDSRYLLSRGTTFFTENGILTNLTSFNQGTEVTFVLGNDGKTIVKLIKGKNQ